MSVAAVEFVPDAAAVEFVPGGAVVELGPSGAALVDPFMVQGPAGAAPRSATVSFVFSGGDNPILPGQNGFIVIPFDCTIDNWTLLGTPSGSITIDIAKSSYAQFPANTSITGTAKPQIASAQSGHAVSVPTWANQVLAGDILTFTVTACSLVVLASLNLSVTRT